MTSIDLTKPPTEIEIAEILSGQDEITKDVIRRLAFERDKLQQLIYDSRREQSQIVANAMRELDPPVCRLQFPDGTVPGNVREAAEGWKKIADEERATVSRVWKALGISSYADAQGSSIDELVADLKRRAELWERLHDQARVCGGCAAGVLVARAER